MYEEQPSNLSHQREYIEYHKETTKKSLIHEYT